MTDAKTTAERTNGRDAAGRFQPGNSFGKGRPKKETERAYRDIFTAKLPPSEFGAVVASMVKAAKSGSVAAARLLFNYALGKPSQTIEIAAEPEEFRVAGLTSDELNTEMMRRLLSKIQERRAYEADVRNQGYDLGLKSDTN